MNSYGIRIVVPEGKVKEILDRSDSGTGNNKRLLSRAERPRRLGDRGRDHQRQLMASRKITRPVQAPE